MSLARLEARRETCGTAGQLTETDCGLHKTFRTLQSLRLGLSIPVIFAGVAPVSVALSGSESWRGAGVELESSEASGGRPDFLPWLATHRRSAWWSLQVPLQTDR